MEKVGFPGLGPALKVARNKAGYSQMFVAESIGVSWMTILRWEQGKRTVPLTLLRQLESLYEASEFVPDQDAIIKTFCQNLKQTFWRDDLGWTTNVTDCIDNIIDAK